MSNAVIPVDVVRHVLANGVGRYVCQLQRLTFRFCKEWAGSHGMREYIEKSLVGFAHHNPGVVVYLQPQRHNRAFLVAEYLNGHKEEFCVDKMAAPEISKWVELFRTRSGQPISRIRKPWLTSYPSIQGIWNPDTWRPSALNVSKFPDPAFSEAFQLEKTATDVVKDLVKKK